ncbi:MAG: ester cyclase [Bacillota bacterium]
MSKEKKNKKEKASKNQKSEKGVKMSKKLDSNKIFYGDSSKVNSVGYKDYNDYLKNKDSLQNMKGFDSDYNDFVDYILKITHRIWEEKGIGVIYDTYHNNVVMHAASRNISGIQSVISGTLQTLHAFPDRRLIGQNVVWTNYKKDGYMSSHRILSTATNLGDSSFGPATGKKINFRTTVDCAVHNNRIHEEWLVRDNLWIVKQLGLDPNEVAKNMAKTEMDESIQNDFGLNENMDGQFFPEKYKAKDDSVGEFMLEMLNSIYQRKMINKVKDYYEDNSVVHFICDKDLIGFKEIQGMFISLFASFPNAEFIIDRIGCNKRSDDEGYDITVRWHLKGIHEGIGYFGKPSGNPVDILGINHYHVKNNKVLEEWVTFDGLDVLRQIYKGKVEKKEKNEEK